MTQAQQRNRELALAAPIINLEDPGRGKVVVEPMPTLTDAAVPSGARSSSLTGDLAQVCAERDEARR